VANLMLKEDVVDVVRQNQFHVWAVETIDQGIEILTGVSAGTRGEEGAFRKDTIHGKADQRLQALAEAMRYYGRSDSSVTMSV
jgi:Lon-like ATP-dependent protease